MKKKKITDIYFIFFYRDGDRYIEKDGFYFSPILDSIADSLKEININCHFFSISSTKKGNRKIVNINNIFIKIINRIRYLVKNYYGLDNFFLNIQAKIIRQYIPKLSVKRKFLVSISAPDFLIRTAKKEGFTIVEHCHGHGQTRNHKFYGINALSRQRDYNLIPDIYILLSYWSLKNLKKNFTVLNLKYPRFKWWINPSLRYVYSHEINNIKNFSNNLSIKKSEILQKSDLNILYSLGGKDPNKELMSGLFIKILKSNLNKKSFRKINLLIRLHPLNMNKKDFIKSLMENLDLINLAKNKNLNILIDYCSPQSTTLKYIDIHATYSSTISMELAQIGIKTLIFSKDMNILLNKDSPFYELLKSRMCIVPKSYQKFDLSIFKNTRGSNQFINNDLSNEFLSLLENIK